MKRLVLPLLALAPSRHEGTAICSILEPMGSVTNCDRFSTMTSSRL